MSKVTRPSNVPNDIVLNDWAAKELQASVGDVVTMDYYLWRDSGILGAASTQFSVARCVIVSTSALNTTGIRYSVTVPAGATQLAVRVSTMQSAITALTESFSTSAFVSTSATSIITVPQLNQIDIVLRNGATAGTVQLTIDPSAATAVTAEIGSYCMFSGEN